MGPHKNLPHLNLKSYPFKIYGMMLCHKYFMAADRELGILQIGENISVPTPPHLANARIKA
jgi:hypothetical protein